MNTYVFLIDAPEESSPKFSDQYRKKYEIALEIEKLQAEHEKACNENIEVIRKITKLEDRISELKLELEGN